MAVVVSVRGGCGAGKSTLVRTVMSLCGQPRVVSRPGRRRPVGYELPTENLFVPGHYEIQNGGLDTIGDLHDAHSVIGAYHSAGWSVLFEGMNQKRDAEYLARYPGIVLVFLDIPLDDCERAFRAKGQTRDVEYVRSTWRKAQREIAEFQDLGYTVHACKSRTVALSVVRNVLEIAEWTS